MKGEKNLIGDLLHNFLYDIDKDKFIPVPNLPHDKLYRIIKNAILSSVGKYTGSIISKEEIDIFINAIFDVQDKLLGKEGIL